MSQTKPNSREELDEQINDCFARSCKNNEYFGNDGWYELHTPTLRQEIQEIIDQHLTNQLEKAVVEARIDENESWIEWLHDTEVSYNNPKHTNKTASAKLHNLLKARIRQLEKEI